MSPISLYSRHDNILETLECFNVYAVPNNKSNTKHICTLYTVNINNKNLTIENQAIIITFAHLIPKCLAKEFINEKSIRVHFFSYFTKVIETLIQCLNFM